MSPHHRAIIRAEVAGTAEAIERLNEGRTMTPAAVTKMHVTQMFLAGIDQLIQRDAPPARLAEVFQVVARHELEPATYQRLVIVAQQRLLLDRQRETGLSFRPGDMFPDRETT